MGEGALGVGLIIFWHWRPAWLICAQKWLPLRVPAVAHAFNASFVAASGSSSTTTLPGRYKWSRSICTLPESNNPAQPSLQIP